MNSACLVGSGWQRKLLAKRKSMSKVVTNDDYWDCECKEEYIHARSKGNYCPRCGRFEQEQPDSRENELGMYRPEKDRAVFKDYEERQPCSVAFRPKQKGAWAGTFVRVTRTRAPEGLAVGCVIEGVLLVDVEVGKPAHLAKMERNGELVDGVFVSAPVASVAPDGFSTADAVYRTEPISEPGEFSPLAELLLRDLKPYEVRAL